MKFIKLITDIIIIIFFNYNNIIINNIEINKLYNIYIYIYTIIENDINANVDVVYYH